jgi:hypothetical protein
MTDVGGGDPLRPFFPSATDFAAATTPHFSFLIDEFRFAEPVVTGNEEAYDIRYDGPGTAVLLTWEIASGYFGCELAPRAADGDLDPDYENWLTANEILAARGVTDRWVVEAEFDNVDEEGYATVMSREADNLRTHCADVLRGDWSVRDSELIWPTDKKRR